MKRTGTRATTITKRSATGSRRRPRATARAAREGTHASSRAKGLALYRRKRNFAATPEPRGAARSRRAGAATFVVHLHHARARHFDLRLQVGDGLRSWAVPKGPSLDPRKRRLAVQVEDHPLDYGGFEGVIPARQYGAGRVWIWDRGTWTPDGDPARALRAGHLRFTLHGGRLTGAWSLIRTRPRGRQQQWLLIKGKDSAARSGDEADDVPLSAWRRDRSGAGQRSMKKPGKAPSGARLRPPPAQIELQLARLASEAPRGREWLHEVKYDGYRLLIWRSGNVVRITSRGSQDWTRRLAAAARAVAQLPCTNCVLDAELVALDPEGVSSFGKLQQLFGAPDGEAQLRIMVFDLLYLDGEDLRPLPQSERKTRLAQLLSAAAPPLTLTTYTTGDGATAARAACEQGLEGIVSKSANAPYSEGRGDAWRKIKCVQSDEFAIVGYTPGQGAREKLGSLLLGTPVGSAWRYVGRVGTGFDSATLASLLRRLKPATAHVSFESAPSRAQLRGARPVWVTPTLVVEAEYRGHTSDGLLRQASLKGLRPDRSIDSVRPGQRNTARVQTTGKQPRPERAAPRPKSGDSAAANEVRLTHPDRVLMREPPITKQELADFYRSIADFILPGLVNRPLMLLRCPDGDAGECFFQKHAGRGFPAAVRQVSDRASQQRWIYVDGLEGLLGLVQMNSLEYHVWEATVADLDHADRVVIDLDPAPGVPWQRVLRAALEIHARLIDLKLKCFVRTSGGKGLHVVIPVRPATDWDSARGFARAFAEQIAADHPQEYLAVATKARRHGKIFIDHLRNGRGATAVCSYSLRNRPGAPIATPLSWEELPRVRASDQFGFADIRQRLAHMQADPWAGIDRITQALPDLNS